METHWIACWQLKGFLAFLANSKVSKIEYIYWKEKDIDSNCLRTKHKYRVLLRPKDFKIVFKYSEQNNEVRVYQDQSPQQERLNSLFVNGYDYRTQVPIDERMEHYSECI